MTLVVSEITTQARAVIVHGELAAMYAADEAVGDLTFCRIASGPYPPLALFDQWVDQADATMTETREDSTDTLLCVNIREAGNVVGGWGTDTPAQSMAYMEWTLGEGAPYRLASSMPGHVVRDHLLDTAELNGPWDPRTYSDPVHGGLSLDDLADRFALIVTDDGAGGHDWTAVLQ